jgi:hypothetical protein
VRAAHALLAETAINHLAAVQLKPGINIDADNTNVVARDKLIHAPSRSPAEEVEGAFILFRLR